MPRVIPTTGSLGFFRQDGGQGNTFSFNIPLESLASYPPLKQVDVGFRDSANNPTDEFDTVNFRYSQNKACLIVKVKHKKKVPPLKEDKVEVVGTSGYFAVTITYGPPTSPTTEICQLPGVLYDD